MIEQPNTRQRPVANRAGISAEPQAVVLLPAELSPRLTRHGSRLEHRRAALSITRQRHGQLHLSQPPLRNLYPAVRRMTDLGVAVAVDAVQAVSIAAAIRLWVVEIGR